ncbi:MAG: PAS domain S-box protein [Candidatus Aminicenantes bacterium]|nr:MAG: PAS domain S-box protein [Candidatus Aminicenantes bacterium]
MKKKSSKQIDTKAPGHKALENFRTLEETRSQLAAIVESSNDAIIGKTLDGIITSWNIGAERIYGYTSKEIVGRSISILSPPGRPDEVPQILKKIKDGERIDQYETVRLRKNGKQIDVSLTISPIRNAAGKIIGASTVARNITAHKKADEALRESEHALRERVKELTCLYSLAKLVERHGISLEEILEGIVELLPPAWLYPEIASARIVLNGQTYATRRFQEGGQRLVANIVVDGEQRGTVEVAYSESMPELDEGPFLKDERSLIDAIAREVALIVERKQTEEDKARLQEQLRHADRLATIGQLSAGVAHELNEPIGSILGFAQLIQKYPKISKQIRQDIEKIMNASLHAREVVKKLMLFARQMPPQKTHVNMNQVIEEGLYFLESRCAKEGIKVARSLSPDLPEITADPAQMTQVLVNVVVNAIQAMPNGGKLIIQTKGSDKFVFITIEDTGVGMSEKVMRQIFLPFFTTKDVGQGTGLGLAVVHGIVTSHGGLIDVNSQAGQGTRFEIQLPIKESQDMKEKG